MNDSIDMLDAEHCAAAEPLRWVPVWPQEFSIGWLASEVIIVLTAALFLAGAIGAAGDGDTGVVVGFSAAFVGTALAAAGGLEYVGVRWVRLSRRITLTSDDDLGIGLRIPVVRARFVLAVVAFAGFATMGLTAALVWYTGWGESLLPFVHDNRAGANWMAFGGLVFLLLLGLFAVVHTETVVCIYPTGVRRYARRRILLSFKTFDAFVRWEDIDGIESDTHVVQLTVGHVSRPLIKLQLNENCPTPEKLVRTDPDRAVVLIAFWLVAEPNALLGLLQFLMVNPDRRDLVARSDAPLLLAPPSLREWFKISRQAAKEALDV
ncbi:hypothetical protein [Speluncibacter jeojiensis]|uniref:Uncharacterized protein n=1 Tax=Speluncibacter jeojiensis TaxID=2710754 RepID=A0A9X4M3W2_9ACTN|nr:hypothetical protein [Corynebacteriales bacterium D3-21]